MQNIGLMYSIGAAVVWGLVYTLDQKILNNLSPSTLLFVSSLIVMIIMLPFVLFDSEPIKTFMNSGRYNITLVISSVLLAALANFLIFSSIKILNASAASFIEISYPFFVVLFSFIIFRAMPSIYFLLGGILIFLGSFIIFKLG